VQSSIGFLLPELTQSTVLFGIIFGHIRSQNFWFRHRDASWNQQVATTKTHSKYDEATNRI
jgi:hypothetical protein